MNETDNNQLELFKEGNVARSNSSHRNISGSAHANDDDSVKLKYALVNGEFSEATPSGARGICPHCHAVVIARDGKQRQRHWKHKVECEYSPGRMTEWHQNWQKEFPEEWCEKNQDTDENKKHRADVITSDGWVIEIQHSPIKLEDRESREKCYLPKMIWIVNGTRLKLDLPNFFDAWNKGLKINEIDNIRQIHMIGGGLIRDWQSSNALVFFDFEDGIHLYGLLPHHPDGKIYVFRLSKSYLIQDFRSGKSMMDTIHKQVLVQVIKHDNPEMFEKMKMAAQQAQHPRPMQQVQQRPIQTRVNINQLAALMYQMGISPLGAPSGSRKPPTYRGEKKTKKSYGKKSFKKPHRRK